MLLVLGNDGYETGILGLSKQCTMLSQLAHKTDSLKTFLLSSDYPLTLKMGQGHTLGMKAEF